jgi:hypothetical protein
MGEIKMRRLAAIKIFFVCFAALFLTAGWTESPQMPKHVNVTTSIMCIEISEAEIENIEKQIGFSLNPLNGKIILTPEERKKLLDAVEKSRSAKILGSESVTSLFMCQCGIGKEESEEIRYPASYKTESSKNGVKYVPEEFETQKIGLWGGYTPTEVEGTNLINLRISLDMRGYAGWKKYEDGISQPVIKSWNLSCKIMLSEGMTYVSKSMPPLPFEQSSVLPKESDNNKEKKCCLFLIAAKKNIY